jgi:hypothetical protein
VKGPGPKSEDGRKAESRPAKPGVTSFFGRVLSAALSVCASHAMFAAEGTATNSEIPALRPPHAEIPPSFWDLHGVWVIVGVGILLALLGAAIWFFTRPKPLVVVPPEVLARQALEHLGQQPEDGALLSRVSRILREYLRATLRLPSDELTTTELCRVISDHEQVGVELSVALREFLLQCDQRKFSPLASGLPLGAVARALKLVERTQARLAAPPRPMTQPDGGSEGQAK